jgi:uncharacterized membrane-anchored protein
MTAGMAPGHGALDGPLDAPIDNAAVGWDSGPATEDLAIPYEAVARVDRRTKDLLVRVRPGEIAVIDHEDIDRLSAEGLIRAKVGAVVNAARSISGRYPNMGPLLIAAAGIPIVDGCGPKVIEAIEEADIVRVVGGVVFVGDRAIAHGEVQTLDSLEAQLDAAKLSIGRELEKFAENTLQYMREERDLVVEGVRVPDTRYNFEGRHALVVVRGYDYKQDLAALSPYIRDVRPILIGVDGGADALMEQGLKPDIVIGDFDSVSTDTLASGAELIVHTYPDGRAPGAGRLDDLGLDYLTFQARGTSEDIAMLLAYEKGAELIVAVGTHASMVEFLDKGRAGMASTFLTRLRVGPILVDAKGVNRLYRMRLRKRDVLLLILAALVTMAIVISISEPFQLFLKGIWIQITELYDKLFG